jgi:phosphoglucomutase
LLRPPTWWTSLTWSPPTTRASPDPDNIDQQVAFGTSGTPRLEPADLLQRGCTSSRRPRRSPSTGATQGFDGPLFIGRDTHGLSEPAWATALEVLVANDVTVLVDADDELHPDPAVSHAILVANRGKITADGIVVTPSHNPPGRRRLQVQPAARRPGRQRRDEGDRGPRQRADPGRAGRMSSGTAL